MANEPPARSPEGEARVLLLPPTRRDAGAIQKLLAAADIACVVCSTMSELCDEVGRGAGAVLVSEESLTAEPDLLLTCVRRQPVWSDLPTLILSRSGAESPALTAVLPLLGNVSVLERPMRVTTLMSLVRSSLRGRERQYQVRNHLAELKRAEQELRASEEQLRVALQQRAALLDAERSARAESERAGRMKDEFLATLSHELRTPLNAILGWSQILVRRVPADGDLSEGLKTIERNARAQTKIIEDLLDMSRIISGKVRLDVQKIDVGAVVLAAVETVRPAADARGIRLNVSIGEDDLSTNGDPNRLQQVFWNLLSNAVKFTPRDQSVKVRLERVDSHIEVSVIDTGDGISPEFLPQVFERFRQADASTTRRHGGLGLGLAIVKQLVELHGGSVRARSSGRGQGATFIVSLPQAAVAASSHAATRRGQMPTLPVIDRPTACEDIAGATVLVVDDEEDSRTFVMRLLEEWGAIVIAAASADEAIGLMESAKPDVVISDIGMPDEDGFALIRKIRALPVEAGGQTPAIALTAYARAEDRTNTRSAGFQHHLAKPVEPAELIATVAALLRAGKT